MMETQADFLVRDSQPEDVPAITKIYARWVLNGLASFELEPPGVAEMTARRSDLLVGGYPYLVAVTKAGEVLGYAYAGPYRARPAYRFACEDSIYISPGGHRRAMGRALLTALIGRCEMIGLRLMIAVIGDSGNAPSIRLHEMLGFKRAGLLEAIGWKHGRWVDSVLMTRPLGAGASTPPEEAER